MRLVIDVSARGLLLLAALVAAAVVGVLWWWAAPAGGQEEPAGPIATFAFLARADNPVDALAAGALAGQLGGPVLLTGSTSLDAQAADGLVAANPEVVVLAGGTAALSDTVQTQVAELLPDAEVRRVAGAGRTETARLLGSLPAELGIGRPVLTGATVVGDVGIDGSLTVDGVDVAAALAALGERVDALEAGSAALTADLAAAEGRIDTLETDLAAAEGRIDTLEAGNTALTADLATAEGRVGALETTLAGVSRDGDLLTFEGMNVQVTNGEGRTASTNGLGNLIVGYHEDHTTNDCQPSADDCQYVGDGVADSRSGSHMLIVGVDHAYTSYGGIVAGQNNTTSGFFASVTGGIRNTASGGNASVTGGIRNTASGANASVTGGLGNTASGGNASVTGGVENIASGDSGSVTGGSVNVASGTRASVTGGTGNTASGSRASVSGGLGNAAAAFYSAVAGGRDGAIASDGDYDSLIGNSPFTDS